MKKHLICALAMLAIVVCVAGCGKKSPVSYAPADADLIAYINFQKISANKIYTTLRAREDAKAAIAEAEKQSGLKVDDVMKSDAALFVNTKTFDGGNIPAMSGIVCFAKDNMPAKIFDNIKKQDKTTKETKIEGKTALTAPDGSVAIIALNQNTMQVSAKQGDKPFVCLTAKGDTALTKAVDQNALISIAFKAGDETRKMAKEALGDAVPNDITFVTANLRENKDSLDLELVVKFEKADSAKAAQEFLVSQRDAAKGAIDDAELKKTLEGVKIEAKGQKLVLTASEKVDEILATINKMAPAAK